MALEASRELQQANDRMLAIARATALQTMIGGVAHELNQPLAALGNYLNVLRARLAGPGDRPASRESEIVERAEEQLSRCAAIMQKLRNFGGSEAFLPVSLRLRDLVDEAVALSLVREREPGLRLSVVHSEEPIVLVVDATQLKLAIINLLQNAVEASAGLPERQVEIHTTLTDESWVRIAVSDRGPGVPVEVQKRLFQPFVTSKPGGNRNRPRRLSHDRRGQRWTHLVRTQGRRWCLLRHFTQVLQPDRLTGGAARPRVVTFAIGGRWRRRFGRCPAVATSRSAARRRSGSDGSGPTRRSSGS